MAFSGGEYLVTGTATSVAAALGLTEVDRTHVRELTLRNDPGALNPAYFGHSTVTTAANRAGVLGATDTEATYLMGAIDLNEVFLVGTANAANIIHISLVR
jgi:hypothetical protein